MQPLNAGQTSDGLLTGRLVTQRQAQQRPDNLKHRRDVTGYRGPLCRRLVTQRQTQQRTDDLKHRRDVTG